MSTNSCVVSEAGATPGRSAPSWRPSVTAIGPIAVADGRNDGLLLPGQQPTSDATQRLVDEEVRRIVDEAEQDTIVLLERERPRLEALAKALLTRETLDQAEAYEIAGVSPPAAAAEEPAPA